MNKKDKINVHDKEVTELQKMLKEAREILFTANMEHKQGKLKNTRGLSLQRDSIAKLLTVLKEKELKTVKEAQVVKKGDK